MTRAVFAALILAVAMGATAARLLMRQAEAAKPELSEVVAGEIPPVRVLLASASRGRCEVRVDGPYRVSPIDDWRVLAQGEKLAPAEVSVTGRGIQIGSREFPVQRLTLHVVTPGSLWVGSSRYRGSLQLVRRSDDALAVINVVELEEYVASVVNGEMPGDFPEQARIAQSIAARSYALFHMKAGGGRDHDLHDTSRSQVYRGMEFTDAKNRRLAVETRESRELVATSRGMVLTYQGRLFCPFFSAVCGGQTASGRAVFNASSPPLVGVACTWCQDAKNYRWEVKLSREQLEKKLSEYLHAKGRQLGELKSIDVMEQPSGATTSIRVVCADGEQLVSGLELYQNVLGPGVLLSGQFSLRLDQTATFSGRGWGHGVGLCQWGARGQALQGRSGIEILAYYYPGSEITRVQ